MFCKSLGMLGEIITFGRIEIRFWQHLSSKHPSIIAEGMMRWKI
jgi:hypothetical protein